MGVEVTSNWTAAPAIEISDEARLRQPVDHKEVYHGSVFGMATDLVDLPGTARQVRRDFLSHTGAVGIVALRQGTDSNIPEICLIRQYRHPVGAYLWEIPAGLRDIAGEAPVETAKRELWEETDLEAATWYTLMDLFTSPGCSTEAIRIFLARDISEAAQKAVREDEEAEIQVRWVPLDVAVKAGFTGQFHACSMLQGVLAAWAAYQTNWHGLRAADAPWFDGGYPAAQFVR